MQLQVINSPFNQEQAELLNRLLPTLTESQLIWLSGYLAASQSVVQVAGASTIEATDASYSVESAGRVVSKEVTILFGSQSGNAQVLAGKAAKKLEGSGFQVTISSMRDFKPNQIKKIQNLLIIVSTYGEGVPPDNAQAFYEFLHSKRAPKLDELRYSVLALGDSSYEFFCQTGKDFDQRLAELGGTRIIQRFDCDLDYDESAEKWVLEIINSFGEAQKNLSVPTAAVAVAGGFHDVQSLYSRTNPFKATVLENINLNGRGSNKETRHLELSLEGSDLKYEPGDSLGIYPENDPTLVDLILKEMDWDPEELVTLTKEETVLSLKEALISQFEITVLTIPLLKQAAQLSSNGDLQELISKGNEDTLRSYLEGRDFLDLVRDFGPWHGTAQQFVSILRKIPVRLYSIASSLTAVPDEVHLTIGAVRYKAHGRERKGVSSIFCAERLQLGDTVPVYIQPNSSFKLPDNQETPIIMIGAGTGIAPFRSFMQEREETGAGGPSWLFFGDQHFVTDFLYQTEWQQWLKDGVLTKMDVAFSRDTEKKVYVQHRMLEQSKELFKWFQEGAVVYICGDKKNMAKDVHDTLLEIIVNEGGFSREQAKEYLTDMEKQNRYQRDVY